MNVMDIEDIVDAVDIVIIRWPSHQYLPLDTLEKWPSYRCPPLDTWRVGYPITILL